MSRTVPKDSNRGPRTEKLTIYLSKEEADWLKKTSESFGFRSAPTMVVYILESIFKGGASGIAFTRLGNHFANLIQRAGRAGTDWHSLNPFKKIHTKPEDYDARQKGDRKPRFKKNSVTKSQIAKALCIPIQTLDGMVAEARAKQEAQLK